VAALTVADGLGTHPSALWNALVEFRLGASGATARNAGDHLRPAWLLGTFTLSGASVVVLALAAAAVRRRADRPLVPAAPVPAGLLAGAALAWEAVAVAGGGSYWWHYQMVTVTGLVLAVAALAATGSRRVVRAALGYGAAVTLVSTVLAPTVLVGPTADPPVVDFLRAHARPGDTGSVAFGDPAILRAAGLSSPYPQLWSLPVEVRDPHLRRFARLLDGPRRPTWIVSTHRRLGTWGTDTSAAEAALRHHYTDVATRAGFVVFEANERRAGAPALVQR